MRPRTLGFLLLLLAAATLGSCQTKIAIVDPHFGFERAEAGKSISLQGRRTLVDWVENVPPGQDGDKSGALVFRLGDCSSGPLKRLGFTLSFLVENRSKRSWPITRGMFDLHNASADLPGRAVPVDKWKVESGNTARKDEVMIDVPAGTAAVLDVPFHLVCPASLSEDEALTTTFHMSIAEPGGHTFLHRQVDTGRWSQPVQGARAVVVFTLALVAIAAL